MKIPTSLRYFRWGPDPLPPPTLLNSAHVGQLSLQVAKYCILFLFKANPCETNPCLNGGSCTKIDFISYECCCTEDYYGEHCEKRRAPPRPPGPYEG